MARYRKIDPKIWNDFKFMELSKDGKLVFLYLLTHPSMTALGAMRASVPGLAAELIWPEKDFKKAFSEVLSRDMVRHDATSSFLWLPKFLKYNKPESPNVVKAWKSSLDLLPECDMKSELIRSVKDYTEALPLSFLEALPEVFLDNLLKSMFKTMPYQEQEQEQNNIYIRAFDERWKKYPAPEGKKEALESFLSSVYSDDLLSNFDTAFNNYIKHLKANPWKSPKLGKTFFGSWQEWTNWQEPSLSSSHSDAERKQIKVELRNLSERLERKKRYMKGCPEDDPRYIDLARDIKIIEAEIARLDGLLYEKVP